MHVHSYDYFHKDRVQSEIKLYIIIVNLGDRETSNVINMENMY